MAGVCSGNGPCDVHPTGHGGDNFVTRGGGFDPYLRAIINALKRKGHPESQAVQIAIGTVQRWARGQGNVTAATRARAAASLAHWEALKAKAHSLNAAPAARTVDLAMSPAQRKSVDQETAAIRERATTAKFPHKFVAANWTHPNGHPRCKNCGQEESIGGMCAKPTEKTTAGPSTSIPLTARPATTVDLTFTESLHPRNKGKFAPKGSATTPGSAASTPAGMAANVRDFQRRMGLPVTGVIDPTTAAKIRAELAAKGGGGRKGSGKTKARKAAAAAKRRAKAATRGQRQQTATHVATVNAMTPAQRATTRARMPIPPTGYVWSSTNTLRRFHA